MTETLRSPIDDWSKASTRSGKKGQRSPILRTGEGNWIISQDLDNPGKLAIDLYNQEIFERYNNIDSFLSDPQSFSVTDTTTEKDEMPIEHASQDSYISTWNRLSNEALSVEDRVEVLFDCIKEDEDRSASYVAEELLKDEAIGEWRNVLVIAAETLQFRDLSLRDRLWRKLLDIALERRQNADPSAEVVTLAAIRRLGAMIPEEEMMLLVPLLDPPNPVETRLLTLQRIGIVFEFGPPTADLGLEELTQRVHELACKFTDRDLLIAGRLAAIGMNAILALAYLGNEQLTQCVQEAINLNYRWFSRQLLRKLNAIRNDWESQSQSEATCSLERIIDAIQLLRESFAQPARG